MKKIILALLLFKIVDVYSQNIEVIYEVQFQSQNENKNIRTEYMTLKIVNKSSVFMPSKYIPESKQIDEDTYLNFIIVQNNNALKYYGKFSSLHYFYEEQIPNTWNLSLTKSYTWKNYTCNDAKIKLDDRNWNVMYSSDIPFNYGPYKFSGLPGLVLKASSEDGEYQFEMVEIKKIDTEQGKENYNSFQKIEKTKLHLYINNFIKDPAANDFLLINSFGDSYDYTFKGKNSEEYKSNKKFMVEIINKYNNPIDKKTHILVF